MNYTTEKIARKQVFWSHKKTFPIANSMSPPLRVVSILRIGKKFFCSAITQK